MSSKRRLQFGLRGMLVLITLAAISFSVYRRYTAYLAIDSIQKKAVFVRPEPKATGWQRLYSNDVYRVHHLSFHGSFGVTDEDVAAITRLPWIRRLSLHRTQVTDESAAFVAKLSELEALSFQGTAITDAGMASLAGLTKLKSLSLIGLPLTDKGLKYVSGMTELEELLLDYTTPTTLDHFRDLKNLERFELKTATVINPSSISNFEDMTRMERLHLPRIPFTRTHLDSLRRMSGLKELSLRNAQFEHLDSGVWNNHPKLKFLHIGCHGRFEIHGHQNLETVWIAGRPTRVSVRELPRLVQFSMNRSTNDVELALSGCPSLESLVIDAVKSAELSNLTSLKTLDIFEAPGELKLNGLPAMRTLRFSYTDIEAPLLKELVQVGGAYGLDQIWCHRVTVNDFASLQLLHRHQNLHRFEALAGPYGRPWNLSETNSKLLVKFLQGFPNLEHISLPSHWTKNRLLLEGLREMKQLRSIRVGCKVATRDKWERLLELPKLDRLQLHTPDSRILYVRTPIETDNGGLFLQRRASQVIGSRGVNGRRFSIRSSR